METTRPKQDSPADSERAERDVPAADADNARRVGIGKCGAY